jgi:hypothetical protein
MRDYQLIYHVNAVKLKIMKSNFQLSNTVQQLAQNP